MIIINKGCIFFDQSTCSCALGLDIGSRIGNYPCFFRIENPDEATPLWQVAINEIQLKRRPARELFQLVEAIKRYEEAAQ